MAESHVVSGLVSRRAEVAGELTRLRAKEMELERDLSTLDNAILLFDPDYRLENIKPKGARKPRRLFARGELIGLVFQALRDAGTPLSLVDVSQRVARARDLDMDLRGHVRHALKEQVAMGTLVKAGREADTGRPLWTLVDQAARAGRKTNLTPLRP